MKLLVKITILIFALIISLSLMFSSLMDPNALRDNLQISLDKKIEGDFIINGAAKVNFFPSLAIVIEKASLRNAVYDNNRVNISMQKVIVNLGFSSLFGKIKIDELEFISPVIEWDFFDPNATLSKKEEVSKEEMTAEVVEAEEVLEVAKKEEDKDIEEKSIAKEMGERKNVNEEVKEEVAEEVVEGIEAEISGEAVKDDKKIDIVEERRGVVYDDTKLVSRIFKFNENEQEIFDIKSIKNIEVINGYFKRRGLGGEIILDVKDINFISNNNISNQNLGINGSLLVNDIPTQFDLLVNTRDNADSKLIVNSPILKVELEGEFFDSDFNNLIRSSFSGKLQANIVNPKEFFNKYFSKYNLIYGKVNSVSAIKLGAQIESNKGNYKISDIELDSQVISGTGYVNANFSSKNAVIDSKIQITDADIDSLWSARYVGHSSEIIDFEKNIMEQFISGEKVSLDQSIIIGDQEKKKEKQPLFDSLKMDVGIKIDKAKYFHKFLSDVDIVLAVSENGALQIKKATMKIPDGGEMKVSGFFKKTNNISNFIGSYQISGRDFNNFLSWIDLRSKVLKSISGTKYDLSGEIILLSSFSALKGLKVDIDNGKNIITGNIRYDDSKDLQNADVRLNIDKLNLTDYFDISFERNQYVSPGSLSRKLLWLNTIEAGNDISLTIDELKYHNHTFLNQEINLSIGPGVFHLKELDLESQDKAINIKLSIATDLRLKPMIELDLQVDDFKYITSKLEDNKKFNRLPISNRFFLLPTLIDFNGKIKIKSSKFSIDNIDILDVDLAGSLVDGVWSIKDGSLKVYDGDFKYNGDIVLRKVKSLNGSFTYTQVDNRKFLKDVIGLNTIGGVSNVSGIFNAHGINSGNFVRSLDTKLQFIGANVKVSKFGLSELLKRMLLVSYSKIKITNPEVILFNKKYHTTFKNVKGSLELSPVRAINKLKISADSSGINAITTGSVDLDTKSFSGLSKIIFLTGTRQNKVPINIAISHKGKFSKLNKNANLEQVKQYLQRSQQ